MIPHIMLKSSLVLLLSLPVVSCQMYPSAKAFDDKGGQAIAAASKKVAAEPVKLIPVDEGPEDPSFAEFRRDLLVALQTHDERFVLSILDKNIRNAQDGERGLAEFKKLWEFDQPDSAFWDELTTVLKMGGSFRLSKDEGKEFCAPYVTCEWSTVWNKVDLNADAVEYFVVTDKDVAMRSEPNANAPTVTTLTYDVVAFKLRATYDESSGWMKVTTLAGQDGYVPDKSLRSASQHHAIFKKVKGKWMMTVFAAIE